MKETSPANKPITPETQLSRPALRFDWTDWLPYLDQEDVPDDQKRALIESLWSIVLAFTDLGWNIKSSAESCGEALDLHAVLAANMVRSDETQNDEEAAHDK